MQQEEFEFREEQQGVDIRKIINKALSIWPWMLLCGILTAGLTVAYLYFSVPAYKINASILIKDQDNKMSGSKDMSMLQNIGLLGGASNVDNELQIIQSYTLMNRVVRDMQLNVTYFVHKGLKDIQYYDAQLPFKVYFLAFDEELLKTDPLKYELSLNGKDKFVLKDKDKRSWSGHWGDTLTLPAGKAVFVRTAGDLVPADNQVYSFVAANTDQVTAGCAKALTSEIPNKQVSTINLTLESSIPSKGEDILNKLIEVYMQANVDDNNRIADSTTAFIDIRLLTIGEELANIEKNIQMFMQRNELANITEQSKALIDNTSEYAKSLAQQEVQLSVIEALQNHLNANINNLRIVPASMMVQDASLSNIIDKYNTLLMQRERMLLSSTEDNPMVKSLDGQLMNLRGDLVANLSSLKSSMQVAVNELRRKSGSLESKIRQVPAKEREFLDYSRQQAIKQELYLFLLQKREEAAISKSSTIANARVIDAAKSESRPFKPKKMLILAAAVLVGLLIPFALVYLKELLSTKISTRADIENGTQATILGEIGHNDVGGAIVVTKTSRSPIAEQFRMLRTNLQYLLAGDENKVIMLTSSMPGEGKSFVSTNLAVVMALSGKKVALLELDLRKPRISQSLGVQAGQGFSNYAIGQANIEDILYPNQEYPGLYIMPSGPIPPNPAELLLLDRTRSMFAYLRENFDYIIVDTTPNLVTDAQLLSMHADATLYLVRVGVTHKDQLKLPEAIYREKKMPRLSLVVNDVNYKKYAGYYGGSGYGYGYGYYGEEADQPKKWWKGRKKEMA
ncbi:GumC family protein [Taibaiella chishuiensis]|uniref:non-specific protein-tyrosine kinase n=1 Tax=Taibaiella chishuiensis TaxID=1434707 RepID=A0A2P8D2L5_9BACT|nr:tyrosine-protein kinase [Taibaiella chishuiensis]PSK91460.1 capsular exopolysaccharide synthesis family protein [Taibaiella chishuiensis]